MLNSFCQKMQTLLRNLLMKNSRKILIIKLKKSNKEIKLRARLFQMKHLKPLRTLNFALWMIKGLLCLKVFKNNLKQISLKVQPACRRRQNQLRNLQRISSQKLKKNLENRENQINLKIKFQQLQSPYQKNQMLQLLPNQRKNQKSRKLKLRPSK